jgi:hypothetical protein
LQPEITGAGGECHLAKNAMQTSLWKKDGEPLTRMRERGIINLRTHYDTMIPGE